MPRGVSRAALVLPVLAGLVLCLLAGLAGPAWAGPWVDRAAGSLRDDPLYVNPSARPTLSLPDQERIRARLAVVGTPVFVAILPGQALGEAGGDANRLAALVAASVGRPGTYLVVAGGEEGAGSNTLAQGQAAARAKVAFQQHPELAAATMDFIGRVEDAAGTPPATTAPPAPPPGQQDTDGNTVLVVRAGRRRRGRPGRAARAGPGEPVGAAEHPQHDPVRRGQGDRPGGPGRARRRPRQPQRQPPGRGGRQPPGGPPVHQGVRVPGAGRARRSSRPGRPPTWPR